jgi:hypothetical protein
MRHGARARGGLTMYKNRYGLRYLVQALPSERAPWYRGIWTHYGRPSRNEGTWIECTSARDPARLVAPFGPVGWR